jgi:integrase/recombinase XerD
MDPLTAQRPHLELYIRSMQEIRRFKPATVSRRFSVVAGSTGPASLTASWSTHPPSTSAAPPCPPNHPPWASPTCSSRPCSPPPGSRRTLATSRWWPCSACDLRGHIRGHRRPRRRTRHRVLRVCGKGTKIVLVPLPPAVDRAIDRAIGHRVRGPILLNSHGARMDRHAATRRLCQLAEVADIQGTRAHPHVCHDQFRRRGRPAGRADRRPARRSPHDHAVGPARTWTATRTTSSLPSWPPAPDPACVSRVTGRGRRPA